VKIHPLSSPNAQGIFGIHLCHENRVMRPCDRPEQGTVRSRSSRPNRDRSAWAFSVIQLGREHGYAGLRRAGCPRLDPVARSVAIPVEWFQTLGLKRALPGAVLYKGEQPFEIRGVRIHNPLHVEDIWKTLTEPSGKRKR